MKPEPDILKKVTNSELEFPASTVGYPKDIVRDPVVTIHGPAIGTAWFPTVRHQGNIVVQDIVTDLALRTGNIITDLALRIGNIVTDLAMRRGNIVTDFGLEQKTLLPIHWTQHIYISLVVKQCNGREAEPGQASTREHLDYRHFESYVANHTLLFINLISSYIKEDTLARNNVTGFGCIQA